VFDEALAPALPAAPFEPFVPLEPEVLLSAL